MITWDHLSFPAENEENLHGGVSADPSLTHLYLGYNVGYSRHRQGLGVLALDGTPIQWYPESPGALPEVVSANASVLATAAHPTLSVVYSGWAENPTAATDQVVSYCDLTAGAPGPPVLVASVLPGHVCQAIVYHPTLPIAYFAGRGSQGIARQALDSAGHPSGVATFFAFGPQGKVCLWMNAAGTHLYAGTYPDTVEVYDVDGSGSITAGHTYACPAAPDTRGGFNPDYVSFVLGAAGLYFRRNTGAGPFLSLWKLDGSGYPTGAFLDRTDLALAENKWDFAGTQSRCMWAGTGASANKLWLAEKWTIPDDYTSALVQRGLTVNRYTLNGDGTLAASPVSEAQLWGASCCRLWASPSGTVALAKGGLTIAAGDPGNLVSGMQVRFTATSLTGGPGAGGAASLPQAFQLLGRFGGPTVNVAVSTLNTPTAWVSLDAFLKNNQSPGRYNIFVLREMAATPYYTGMAFTIEVADKTATVLATLHAVVEGTELNFCVPGYAYGPAPLRTAEITTHAQSIAAYRAVADAVALTPAQKPKRYPVSVAQFYSLEINTPLMSDLLTLINDLGCNCGNVQVVPSSSQRYGVGALDALATSKGITTWQDSFYDPVDPPGEYFHYLPDIQSPTLLDAWMSSAFVVPAQIAQDRLLKYAPDIGISDEPGWLQPAEINRVRGNATYLGFFQAWVQLWFAPLGYTPASFKAGATLWTDAGIRPILDAELAAANTAQNRLLFFATHRFFPWSMAQQYLLTRQSFERVSGTAPGASKARVNWNNYVNNLYTPGGGVPGGPGWFDVGRAGSHHPKTESWLTSHQAELWFLWLDVIRVVGLINPNGFSPGCFLVGTPLTGITGAGKAFLLAALASGCKFLEWYSLGPDPIFAESWSEQPNVYQEIASANAFLQGVEDHLFDAFPTYGNVAVLSYATGRIWDPADGVQRLYHDEPLFYISLLCHARGPAGEKWAPDLIDEDEIRRGALSRYAALVITSPNIAADVQTLIAARFNSGSLSLLATPGAGVADEANNATETLTACLGLAAARTADRTASVGATSYATVEAVDTVTVGADANYGTAGATLRAIGLKAPLALATAVSKATFTTGGGVAIAERVSPGGGARAVSFGWYPGMAHWCSPRRNVAPGTWNGNQFYPRDWDPVVQRAGIGGLVAAGVPPAYWLDRPDIAMSLQRSAHGLSLVVQNWTGLPQTQVVLTVPPLRLPALGAARSQVNGSLPLTATALSASVTLPTLAEGDVLLLSGGGVSVAEVGEIGFVGVREVH